MNDAVIWHDLECGCYSADLPLWRELAASQADGTIIEIGAGTGRVAVDLARRGHSVVALERDIELAAELRRRAAGLPLEVVLGDACDFVLPGTATLCIAAMQTVQLLEDRVAFMRCAHRALRPGGTMALAVLGPDILEFDLELPADVANPGGVRYASAPTALRRTPDAVVLERRRTIGAGAAKVVSLDVVRLDRVDPTTLAAEAAGAGFRRLGTFQIAATGEHAGSDVLLLEARA